MSPELLEAVKERISLGRSDDQIREELSQSGYENETITATLLQARETPSAIPVAQSATLPGVFSLIDSSVKYVFSRVDLLLILAAPTLVIALMEFFVGPAESGGLTTTVISILVWLASIVLALATVYIVGVSSQQKASVTDGIQWVKANGFSLIWAGILTGMATLGGFMLLFIPGVIISVYLMLSYFVFVREGHKGMDALMRSRELVYGNWLAVFGRLVGIWALLIVVFMVIAFVTEFFGEFGGLVGVLIATLLLSLAQALLNIAGMKVSVSIYDSLQVTRSTYQPGQHTSTRKKYIGLAWFGGVFPILAAIVLASLNGAREAAIEAVMDSEQPEMLQSEEFQRMMEEMEGEGYEIPTEIE